MGDISVQLKKTDTKRNRYTIELLADDKKTEKKDKSINEPVQFYTSKARQPYELVVNTGGQGPDRGLPSDAQGAGGAVGRRGVPSSM